MSTPADIMTMILNDKGLAITVVVVDECRGVDFSLHPATAQVDVNAAALIKYDIVELIHRIISAAHAVHVFQPYQPPFQITGGAAEFGRQTNKTRTTRTTRITGSSATPPTKHSIEQMDFSSFTPEQVVEWVRTNMSIEGID